MMANKLLLTLLIVNLSLPYGIFAQGQEETLEPSPPLSDSTANTQNTISLDIKGMDVVDVLKILAARSKISLIIGKNVTGRVTLFLKDVDIWDAFELVLLSNDLAYEKKGDIVNVMTQRDYELYNGQRFQDKREAKIVQLKFAKAADLSRSLNQIKSDLGRIVVDENSNTLAIIDTPRKIKDIEEFINNADLPLQTRIFNLNYAQADKLNAKLQEVITKGVGSIKIDERTNKIAITDYPKKLDEIAKIIDAFDDKTTQVLIDAQIIQLTPSDKFEYGVDWDYWIKKYFDIKASFPINASNTFLIGTPNNAPDAAGKYKAVIDILRTIGDTKILSSPRVMVLNNQEAKIHIGTNQAYITSTTSQGGTGTTISSQSVNFVDTGLKLSVTPTINRDGFVTMKIKPEVSSAELTNILTSGQQTTVPIVTTSEADTSVMVKDGVTILIGGLAKDQRQKTVKKVPLLSDMPWLGQFFRSTSDDLTKTELIILLTPHIMSGETSFSDFSEVKPTDGTIVKMVKGEIVKERVSSLAQEKPTSFNQNDYYQAVISKIREFAKLSSPKGKTGKVELSFRLSSDGKLIGEPKVLNSTDPLLEPYALNAIKEASPFPSFPAGLESADELFSITLTYK
ncbi:MAG: TonB C-terminal domain-containing protein [Candidatus Omnitrophica bacterium]|nr:TonB C-terminal domain-containing protein [Candidatus Omnitrophota bacterium]